MDEPVITDAREIARLLGDRGTAALLDVARAAIRLAAEERARLPVSGLGDAPRVPLYGAFVTLEHGEDLRGCIGSVGRIGPAAELVADSGFNATVGDPRFRPVAATELPDLTFEISLLTPLEWLPPDTLPGAVTVGEHGLVVDDGVHRGLLLPQVATEWGWDAPRFLDETCRKAGLPKGAWRHARVGRFSALVLDGGPVLAG